MRLGELLLSTGGLSRAAEELVLIQQGRQRHGAKSGSRLPDKFPSCTTTKIPHGFVLSR